MNLKFIDYITKNPVITLSISITVSLLVWIYKDSKSYIEKNHDSKLKVMENSLQNLYNLESFISLCINKIKKDFESDVDVKFELYRQLAACNSFVSDELRAVIIDFYSTDDYVKLSMMKNMVQVNIEELRAKKKALLFENDTDYIFDYLVKLLAPFQAFITIILFVSFFYIWSSIYKLNITIYQKLVLNLFYFSFCFSILLMYIYSLEKTKNTIRRKNKLYFKIAIIAPLASLVLIFLRRPEVLFLSTLIQGWCLLSITKINKMKKIITKF